MDSSLSGRFATHVAQHRLFPDPGLALLAVSGGPDSVTLAYLMREFALSSSVRLCIGHVDHGLAMESADVAETVMALAVRLGIRGYLESVDLPRRASETRAREARYRALRGLQSRLTARYLVTAHHADDQIETVLFRVLRGSGPAGLGGIAATGGSGLVRPLLCFRRDELRQWLATHVDPDMAELVYHDPSNHDERHDRSWIRDRVLPLIRDRLGERVDTDLLRLAHEAQVHRIAWSEVLKVLPGLNLRTSPGTIQLARAPLRRYDEKLATTLLSALAREVGCVIGPKRSAWLWARLAGAASGRVFDIDADWVVEVAFDDVVIRLRRETLGRLNGSTEVRWGGIERGVVQWGRWSIRWQPQAAQPVRRGGMVTWVTRGSGLIRCPRPGDRLHPLGGEGRRKISRVLMEHRIPSSKRRDFPVLVRDDEVLWVPSVCRAARAVPDVGEPSLRLEASVTSLEC